VRRAAERMSISKVSQTRLFEKFFRAVEVL
jgi:hypothetical protein